MNIDSLENWICILRHRNKVLRRRIKSCGGDRSKRRVSIIKLLRMERKISKYRTRILRQYIGTWQRYV